MVKLPLRTRISADELKASASGRWLEIIDSAGLPAELLDGRGHPCPKCGGRDRFAAWPDVNARGAVHCRGCFAAGSDPAPADGLATLQWLLGRTFPEACQWLADWLGIEVARPVATKVSRTIRIDSEPAESTSQHIIKTAVKCHRLMRPNWFQRAAELLSLPAEVLERMRLGWSSVYQATTWPMFDGHNRIVGVRLRTMTGEKSSVVGSKAGLFVPEGLHRNAEPLFICEGPTDTAAMLSVGLDAIGRPSCNGARQFTADYVRRTMPRSVVIFADNDTPGVEGAEKLAAELIRHCPVRIITAPDGINDARAWVARGATTGDIMAVVNATEARTLEIMSGVRA